jgi:signal transduction histidine kinase/CheY-like chemotaxis protein
MDVRLLLVTISDERDIVLVRKRARRLTELIGFDHQDQTRITTAVSEIARNALDYARAGEVEFRLRDDPGERHFAICVRDRGPGIARLADILNGTHKSATGMGVGLLGARRLMDEFDITTAPGTGTSVRLAKNLPPRVSRMTPAALQRITESLAADGPADAMEEIRQQNRQILAQMEQLTQRQQELEALNRELQDTNRGVVALYAELDERADHLRRADELKSKFLSHMSHEFRTPLNSILALSRLLHDRSDGELNAEQEKQVQFIRKAAENLTELVNDLLDLAKVEAGKTVVAPAEFTVAELFGTLRGMLRPLLVGDAVALVFEDPVQLRPLETDEGKLSQILRNFISNAIKFTEQGEVRIWATADPKADTVTFYVRDTGIGVAAGDLDLIFQEFGQVAHPLQKRIKGTGLGLPLAKKLAELLGGRTAVASVLGQGSTFSVSLPRRYSETRLPAEAGPPVHLQEGKIPLLVIEDDPTDTFILQRLLAESVYQPVFAHSLQQAADRIRQIRPAAILQDVLLLGDESWRFLLEIRSKELLADIPIIVMSSTGEDRKSTQLGADAYLSKPLDRSLLIALLDRLTGRAPLLKVLLVDDEEVSHYLVRQLLPRTHYSLSAAAGGQLGLQALQRDRPDIVVVDLRMPGMDGFEFLHLIGGQSEFAEVPAVVLTSAILSADERSRLGRARSILPKSNLSSEMLMEAIDAAVQQAQTVAVR